MRSPLRILVTIAIVGTGIGLLLVASMRSEELSDNEIRNLFVKHKPNLSELVAFLRAHPAVESVRPGWFSMEVRPGKVLGREKLRMLRELVEKCGRVDHVSSIGGGNRIRVGYASVGISISGYTKGIVFDAGRPTDLVSDTDDRKHRVVHAAGTKYALIEEGWYVYRSD